MAFSLMPGVFQTYLPARWGEVPTMLFGLGAIAVARHPEGVVAMHGRQIRSSVLRVMPRSAAPGVQPGGQAAPGSSAVIAGPVAPAASDPASVQAKAAQ
jgi:branched-chain amino acid transport system permease protein